MKIIQGALQKQFILGQKARQIWLAGLFKQNFEAF
jgi:hypothetical protein